MDWVRVPALRREKAMDLLTGVNPTPLQQVAVFPGSQKHVEQKDFCVISLQKTEICADVRQPGLDLIDQFGPVYLSECSRRTKTGLILPLFLESATKSF